MIEIVPDSRAVFISDINAVVVADLHIGYEEEMLKNGIRIRSNTEQMMDALRKIISVRGAERLIILGDVKHSIGACAQVSMLESLNVPVDVVKGNHDGNIESMLNAKIHPAGGFRVGDYGFVHGHSWPADEVMQAKYVFMGHLHPEIELRDSNGKIHRYPCFLRGSLTDAGKKRYAGTPKIFVVPAFNPLVGSSLATPLGPLMKNKIIGDFEVYLLNGAYLGKLDDIQHSTRSL